GSVPLVAAGPVTLAFSASSNVSLSWEADSSLKASGSDGAAAIAGGSGGALSLYGTAAQLNAYLSGGKLKASLSSGSAGTVAVTLNGASTGIVVGSSAGSSITVSGTSASASAVSLPTLVLPASMSLANSNGQIILGASALGTGTATATATRTVILSVSGGTLSASADAAVGLSANASGSSLTLTGTEAALSGYLASAGKLSFNGTPGTYILTVRAQIKGSGSSAGQVIAETAMTASLSALATVALGYSGSAATPISLANAAAALSMPTLVVAAPGGTVSLPFAAQALVSPGPAALTFTAAGGAQLAWDADAGIKASSASDAASLAAGTGTSITLAGAPELLNAYLAAGKLKAGGLGTITVSGASAGITSVASAALQLSSYGNAGGDTRDDDSSGRSAGGGGGGAGGVGGTGGTDVTIAGDGGDGRVSSITGVVTGYAAGGGGGARDSNSGATETPGLGGIANGESIGGAGRVSGPGGSGRANTGSGGGGVGTSGLGGNGGSGIVVLRFRTGDLTVSAPGVTPTAINVNGVGYQVYSFTTVGSSSFQITSVNTLGAVVEFLAIGGGGSGASGESGASAVGGGGGGAGEMLEGQFLVTASETMSITVGAGGVGPAMSGSTGVTGNSGSASSISASAVSLTAAGGGGGGAHKVVGATGGSAGGGGGRGIVNNGRTAGGVALARPDIGGLSAFLPITANTASALRFTTAVLDDGNASADDTLSMRLAASDASGVLQASATTGVTVVSGNNSANLLLSGKASALQSFLQTGSLQYTGPATGLAITLGNGSNSLRATSALVLANAAASAPSVQFNAPATQAVPTGSTVALAFGAQALAAGGPATLTFTAGSGLTLAWDADSAIKVSANTGAASLSAGSGSTVTLYGAPNLINAYLASSKMRVSGSGSIAVSGAASASITVTDAGSAAASTSLPALALPANFTLRSVNGELRWANALAGSSEALTLILALGSGPNGATPTLSINGSDAAVTVSGSGSNTLTLSGTAAALRNFLNTQDRVLFNGTASSTAYSLTATLQSLSAGVVRSAVTAQAALTAVAPSMASATGQTTSVSLTLPATVVASATNGALLLGSGVIASANASDTLTVTLALSGTGTSSLDLLASSTAAVTASYDAASKTLSLTGTGANLNSYLASLASVRVTESTAQEFYAGQVGNSLGSISIPGTLSSPTTSNFLGDPEIQSQTLLNSYVSGGKQTTAVRYLQNLQDLGTNYTERVAGWLTVPASGWYRFFANGNNVVKFTVQATDSAGMTTGAVNTVTANGGYQWNYPNEWNSAENDGTTAQYLVAGRSYAFEVVHSEADNETYASPPAGWTTTGPAFFQVGYTTGSTSAAASLTPAWGVNLNYSGNNLKLLPMSWVADQQREVLTATAPVVPYTLTMSVAASGSVPSASQVVDLVQLRSGYSRELYKLSSGLTNASSLTTLDTLFAGTLVNTPTVVSSSTSPTTVYASTSIEQGRTDSTVNGALTPLMDTTATSGGDIGDYYAARYSGWLTVPETGYYRFALKANDAARLYISSSSRTELDYGTDLLASASGDSGANAGFNANATAATSALYLQAGEFYRFEVRHYENADGLYNNREHVQLGYTFSASGTPSTTFGSAPNLPTAWIVPQEFDDVLFKPSVEQGLVAFTTFTSPVSTVNGQKNFANAVGSTPFVAEGSGQPTEWVSKVFGTSPVVSRSGGITTVKSTSNTGAGSNYLSLVHGMAANGGSTTQVQQYSVMMDVSVLGTAYLSLLNTDPATDYEIGIYNNQIGSNAALGGYSGTVLSTNTWTRLVLVVNAGGANTAADPAAKAYVNGQLVKSWSGLSAAQLGNLRLSTAAGAKLYLFADETQENPATELATIGLWNRVLTDQEVADLGSASNEGIASSAYLNAATSKVEYTTSAATGTAQATPVTIALPAQININSGGTLNFLPLDSSAQILTGLPDLRSLITDKGWTFNRAGAQPELWTTNLEIGSSVNRADNYTATASGWISVKTTGLYQFWVGADDAVTLRIRDESGSLVGIARDPSATSTSTWDATGVNAVLNTGQILLESGKYYRFEATLTEGTGGDWFRVGYTTPTGTGTYVANVVGSTESYPPLAINTNQEGPLYVFDALSTGTQNTNYFLIAENFGNTANSVVSRDSGLMFRLSNDTMLTGIKFQGVGGNWNPARFTMYGSSQPLVWDDANWSLVGEGATGLTATSPNTSWSASQSLSASSNAAFRYFKLVFNQTFGTANSNYYTGIAGVELSSAAGVVNPLPSGAGLSPTTVTRDGSLLSLTPDFAGTDFTLTLSVDASGLIDVGSAGNVDRLAGLGLVVSADRSASVSLTGSLQALQDYVSTPGVIRYQVASAQDLTYSLTSTAFSRVTSNTSPSPSTAAAVVYSGTPIRLGAVAGDGTVTLTVATSGGTLTNAAGNGSSAGVTSTGSGSSFVSLSGTASAVNAYLTDTGRLSLNAIPGSYTLTVTASGADGTSVKRSTVTVTSPAAVAGTAVVSAVPALTLPGTFTVLDSNGQLTFGSGALGAGTEARTLVLGSSGGTLSANSLSGTGVTASGSGTAALTLSGTQSALSTYLATAGNLLFNGSAGQNYTLTATAQVISGGLVQSATTRQATVAAVAPVALGSSGSATAPAILQLPQSLPIVPSSASDLVLTGLDLDDGNTGGDDSLVLTLTVASGALTAVTGGPVSVAGTATARTLTGT
ncbi:MAG: PA14 domain-containing protein, partial [Betaproteobacteria bacterium]